jgi:hypothetical protein
VDDRPRSVISLGTHPSEPAPRAKPAFRPEPPEPGTPEPPRTSVSLGSAKRVTDGATLTFRDVDRVDFAACDGLAIPEDEGQKTLSIVLASSGLPLTVAPERIDAVSPFLRCLAERTCSLRGPEMTERTAVSLPLEIRWTAPRPRRFPHDAGEVPPFVLVTGLPAKTASSELIRTLSRQAARQCHPGTPRPGSQVEITLDVSGTGKTSRITAARAERLAGDVDPNGITCIAERMRQERLLFPAGFTSTSISIVIEWSPPGTR